MVQRACRSLGRVGVADAHRNTPFDCRLNRLWMQHLRAEIGKLRRFCIRQPFDCLRLRHHARIGGQHAGHVRPDLDLVRRQCSADECGSVVGTTAPERRCCAFRRRGDEPITGTSPFSINGINTSCALTSVSGINGNAHVYSSSVTMQRRASTCCAFVPRWLISSASSSLESISPKASTASCVGRRRKGLSALERSSSLI